MEGSENSSAISDIVRNRVMRSFLKKNADLATVRFFFAQQVRLDMDKVSEALGDRRQALRIPFGKKLPQNPYHRNKNRSTRLQAHPPAPRCTIPICINILAPHGHHRYPAVVKHIKGDRNNITCKPQCVNNIRRFFSGRRNNPAAT